MTTTNCHTYVEDYKHQTGAVVRELVGRGFRVAMSTRSPGFTVTNANLNNGVPTNSLVSWHIPQQAVWDEETQTRFNVRPNQEPISSHRFGEAVLCQREGGNLVPISFGQTIGTEGVFPSQMIDYGTCTNWMLTLDVANQKAYLDDHSGSGSDDIERPPIHFTGRFVIRERTYEGVTRNVALWEDGRHAALYPADEVSSLAPYIIHASALQADYAMVRPSKTMRRFHIGLRDGNPVLYAGEGPGIAEADLWEIKEGSTWVPFVPAATDRAITPFGFGDVFKSEYYNSLLGPGVDGKRYGLARRPASMNATMAFLPVAAGRSQLTYYAEGGVNGGGRLDVRTGLGSNCLPWTAQKTEVGSEFEVMVYSTTPSVKRIGGGLQQYFIDDLEGIASKQDIVSPGVDGDLGVKVGAGTVPIFDSNVSGLWRPGFVVTAKLPFPVREKNQLTTCDETPGSLDKRVFSYFACGLYSNIGTTFRLKCQTNLATQEWIPFNPTWGRRGPTEKVFPSGKGMDAIIATSF